MTAVKRKRALANRAVLVGITLVTLVFPLVTAFTSHAATPTGQTIFEQKCQSCHTIGAGRLLGPDLKGVTSQRDRDWLVRFITAPDQLVAQGDPIARQLVQQYGMPMPNMGLSTEEVKEVLVYIATQSGGQPSPPPPSGKGEIVPIGDASIGKEIFTGKIPLRNGGGACISCHNISGLGVLAGGTVGRDLTTVYATLGQPGLVSLLKTTPLPIMVELYKAKPLTDEEINHLIAFFQKAGMSPETAEQSPGVFIIIGVIGFLFVIGLFQLLWRGRLSGVRQGLVKGGTK